MFGLRTVLALGAAVLSTADHAAEPGFSAAEPVQPVPQPAPPPAVAANPPGVSAPVPPPPPPAAVAVVPPPAPVSSKSGQEIAATVKNIGNDIDQTAKAVLTHDINAVKGETQQIKQEEQALVHNIGNDIKAKGQQIDSQIKGTDEKIGAAIKGVRDSIVEAGQQAVNRFNNLPPVEKTSIEVGSAVGVAAIAAAAGGIASAVHNGEEKKAHFMAKHLSHRKGFVTTLSEPIRRGVTTLEVESVAGMAVGDVIEIGDESNIIKGFSSIILDHPLMKDHPAGTQVKVLPANEVKVLVPVEVPVTASGTPIEQLYQNGKTSQGSPLPQMGVLIAVCVALFGCTLLGITGLVYYKTSQKKTAAEKEKRTFSRLGGGHDSDEALID